MESRHCARFDTHLAAALVVAAAVACSAGAPATESESHIPEYSSIPGLIGAPPRDPVGSTASAGGAANAGAPPVNEGNVPVGGVDAESQPVRASSGAPRPAGAAGAAPDPNDSSVPTAPSDPVESPSAADPPGETSPGAGQPGSATCSLDVTVTTAPHGGRYTPRNVGAIWIADDGGAYVKSLDVWGNRRLSHVEAWNAATNAAGVPQDRVDAVTGATAPSHRTHAVSWDCTNYAGELVPDGSYRVYFEVTEANAAGPNHFETFEKGAEPVSLQASVTNFEGIALSFQP